jgi:hypothetical protein
MFVSCRVWLAGFFLFLIFSVVRSAVADSAGGAQLVVFARPQSFSSSAEYRLLFPDGTLLVVSEADRSAPVRVYALPADVAGSVRSGLKQSGFYELPKSIEPKQMVYDGISEDLLAASPSECKAVHTYQPDGADAVTFERARTLLLEVDRTRAVEKAEPSLREVREKINEVKKVLGGAQCGADIFVRLLADVGKLIKPAPDDFYICLKDGRRVVAEEAVDKSCWRQAVWNADSVWLCQAQDKYLLTSEPLELIGPPGFAGLCQALDRSICKNGDLIVVEEKLCSLERLAGWPKVMKSGNPLPASAAHPCPPEVEFVELPIWKALPNSCLSESCFLQSAGAELYDLPLESVFSALFQHSFVHLPKRLEEALQGPGLYCLESDPNHYDKDGGRLVTGISLVDTLPAIPKHPSGRTAATPSLPANLRCQRDEDCLFRRGTCMVRAVAAHLLDAEPSAGRCECVSGAVFSGCVLNKR